MSPIGNLIRDQADAYNPAGSLFYHTHVSGRRALPACNQVISLRAIWRRLQSELPRVLCDTSLRAFDVVWPAAGDRNSSVYLTPDRLADLVGAEWVDVSQK